ncbi:MAG TPA: YcfL family protein [Candidatus Baltobacteraceae bacterium]|jgi:uncharacterized protein YcfL|nr:YcfL family protein [Candidatus Baltobacteraceae bacterium]
MMKLIQGVFLWGAIVLAAGCASTAPASQPIQTPQPAAPARAAAAQPASASDPRVIIDTALDRTLRVLKVIAATGRNGLLKIQVDVQNITDSPKWFSYRIDWFDQDGALLPMASGDSLPWMLLAGETSSIVATAPAVTAKDFGVAFLASPR